MPVVPFRVVLELMGVEIVPPVAVISNPAATRAAFWTVAVIVYAVPDTQPPAGIPVRNSCVFVELFP